MTTIDERLAVLTLTLKPWMPLMDDPLVQRHIKSALLEVARDQRHADAEAVNALVGDPKNNGHNRASLLRAYQAVMNSELLK